MKSISLVYDYVAPRKKFPNGINFDFFNTYIESDFNDEYYFDGLSKKYGSSAIAVWEGEGAFQYACDDDVNTYDVIHNIDTNKIYLYSISPFGGASCAFGIEGSLHDGRSFFHFIPALTRHLIKNVDNFYLFINYSNEGTLNFNWFDVIYRDAEAFNIPFEKIIYAISDFNINENFNKWYNNFISREENLNKEYKKIKILYHNWSLRDKSCETEKIINGLNSEWNGYSNECSITSEADITDKIRDKKFLMFNRRIRPHRLYTIIISKYLNILDNFLISYDLNKMIVFNEVEQYIRAYLSKYYDSEELVKIYNEILNTHPVSTLDFDDLENVWGFNFETKEPYLNSYIHITAETNFYEVGGYFSEKTWKPVAHLQPFIFMGPVNGLKHIKQFGFKTFSPFIDESYDEEENPTIRFKMIMDEIKRLSDLPIEQIHEWYHSIMKDTLLYNQQLFLSYADGSIMREVFKKNLEEVLR